MEDKGPVKKVEDYYLEAKCGVMTSRFEGMPMVIIEAMSRGLPIVTTPGEGISELLPANYPYISKDYSIQSVSECIESLLDLKKEEYIGLSSSVIRHFRINYSADKMTDS